MVNSMSTKIETARMILRLINEDDLKEVAELNSDPEVRKFFLMESKTQIKLRKE